MTSTIDRVVTNEISIGSTYKTKMSSNVSSDIILTLPSNIGFNRACLTTNGAGGSSWNYAQNSTNGALQISINLPTSNSSALYLSGYSSVPKLVSKINANGNSIFKNRYVKSSINTIATTLFSEMVYCNYSAFSTIKSGAGGNISSKLLNNGCPIISYINSSTSFVTVGICSSDDGTGSWYFETIDSTSIAAGTSICILANGCPAVTYLDKTTTNLMFAVNSRPDGLGTWTISSIEVTGTITSTANNVSMCISANGLPMIAYYYSNTTDLRIAVNANIDGSGAWTITTVDSTNDTGQSPSITLLSNGCPIIAYTYNTTPSLKVAVCSTLDGSSGWTLTTINVVNSNSPVAICILANSLPMAVYFDTLTSLVRLRYAYNTASNGLGTWTIGSIDPNLSINPYVSIGITSVGIPYVIYQNGPAVYVAYNSLITGIGIWTITPIEASASTYSSVLTLNNGYPVLLYYITSGSNLRMMINLSKNSFYLGSNLTPYKLCSLVKA